MKISHVTQNGYTIFRIGDPVLLRSFTLQPLPISLSDAPSFLSGLKVECVANNLSLVSITNYGVV